MSISSIGAQGANLADRLTSDLQKNGLSADKADQVQSEIQVAVQSATTTSTGRPDKASVRSAIEKQLTTDVANGTLTADDANLVRKTLDQFDKQMSAGGASGGPPGGAGGPPSGGAQAGGKAGGGGGGGGGGGSSSQTEVSRSSTLSGGVKTTTITYSDGSKKTETSFDASGSSSQGASSANALLDLLKRNAGSGDAATASTYLKSLLSSGLVDIQA